MRMDERGTYLHADFIVEPSLAGFDQPPGIAAMTIHRVHGKAVDPTLPAIVREDDHGHKAAFHADPQTALETRFLLASKGFRCIATLRPRRQTGPAPESEDLGVILRPQNYQVACSLAFRAHK